MFDITNWIQAIGSVVAIFVGIHVASAPERRHRDRTWDAAVVFGDQLVEITANLRDACGLQDRALIVRSGHLLDELIVFGHSIGIELLPRHNALLWCYELRAIAAEAKGHHSLLLRMIQKNETVEFSTAKVSFDLLHTNARVSRGKLTLVKSAIDKQASGGVFQQAMRWLTTSWRRGK